MTKDIMSVFIEHLDGLYFEGYTQQLAFTNPEAYKTEFFNFKKNYRF